MSAGSGWLTPSGKTRIASPRPRAAAAASNMTSLPTGPAPDVLAARHGNRPGQPDEGTDDRMAEERGLGEWDEPFGEWTASSSTGR